MNALTQLITAYKNGCKIPYQAKRAADEAGIPFYVMLAFLEQETGGGANVFGHDPTIFVGAGKVTKAKYLDYKKERDRYAPSRHQMQGVGPMQLTYYTYQDKADSLGGCWRPYINCLVGAQLLKTYWDQTHDWKAVGTRYNGSSAYGDSVYAKILKWKKILGA